MKELIANFQGYFRINIPKTKWIILFATLFFGLFLFLERKKQVKQYKMKITTIITGLLLSMNISFVFVMTLFGRRVYQTRAYRLIPFESYYILFTKGGMELLLQIIINICMFVTLGFLLPCCFQIFEKFRNVVLVTLISSMGIELIQLIFKMGMFEIDDIIHNVFGAVIGYTIYVLCKEIKEKVKTK